MKNYTKIINQNYRSFGHQEKSNWCWAATSSNVARGKSVVIGQCHIANLCLTQCSNNCTAQSCNQPHYLHEALKNIKSFNKWVPGKLPRHQVKSELNANRTIGVRIAWQGSNNGHFILIFGYAIFHKARPDLHYFVFDPLKSYGVQLLRASALESTNGYQLAGTWSETILTN